MGDIASRLQAAEAIEGLGTIEIAPLALLPGHGKLVDLVDYVLQSIKDKAELNNPQCPRFRPQP